MGSMESAASVEPELARNFALVGHSDQGGRPDGIQVQHHRRHVYVGHLFSGGFSVLDVKDPRSPVPVHHEPAPPNTLTIHLQAADDLLLVVHGKGPWGEPGQGWSAGVAVYDIAEPARPKPVSFLATDGVGVHRLWYVGGRWAYASVLPEGYSDHILGVVDLADPADPRWAGRYHLPGMHTAGGEEPTWDTSRWRYALHHAIVAGDVAYASWRDGGLTLLDVSDRDRPTLISHRNWSPPFGGDTHTALPLPGRELAVVADEATGDDLADGIKPIWVFDVREPANPVSIATFPVPADADYGHRGGRFGPHNLHENRPGTFVSETLIFATYQSAGLRAVDISDAYRPVEVGALVPPPPERLVMPRPGRRPVLQTTDVVVTADGVAYMTDINAGLYVAEYRG